MLWKNTDERGKILLEAISVVAAVICAIDAFIDIVRNVIRYLKQKSNRPD